MGAGLIQEILFTMQKQNVLMIFSKDRSLKEARAVHCVQGQLRQHSDILCQKTNKTKKTW